MTGHHEILVLISSADLGGGECVALDQATRIDRNPRFNVTLAAPDGGWVARSARERGLNFWPVALRRPFSPWIGMKISRRLASGRYHLVHTHLIAGAAVGTAAARRHGIPTVSTVHGLDKVRYYQGADRLIAVSNTVAHHLHAQFKRGGGPPVLVMPNQPDPVLAPDCLGGQKLRESWGLSASDHVIAVIGKLHPNKGQRVAVRMMELLDPSHHLVLVGDGPDRRRLERMIQGADLASRIHLVGVCEDRARVYGAVDAVMIPSYKESFSLVAAETLQCGVRLVAARVGGLSETVGCDAPLVEDHDPATWSGVLRARLQDAPPHPRSPASPTGQPIHPLIQLYEELLGI